MSIIHLNNNRYLIKSGNQYVNFDGVQKLTKPDYIELHLSNQKVLRCSTNHLVLTKSGFKSANKIKPNTKLTNNISVVKVQYINKPIELYDVINSETSQYNTYDIISHNCSFEGSAETLIPNDVLMTLETKEPIQQRDDVYYFEMPQKLHNYVITVDVSRGRGDDYSTFSVFDVSANPYNIVCTFKNNTINPLLEYPLLLQKIGNLYNNAVVLIENNDLGEGVATNLWFDLEYDNMIWTNAHNEISASGVLGVRTTRKVKSTGCQALKDLLSNHQLIVNDQRIIQELNVFIKQDKGLYGASDTKINDDLVQNIWLFSWFTKQNYFQDVANGDPNAKMAKKFEQKVDDYLPLGFRSDGLEDYNNFTDPYSYNQDQLDLMKGF